MNFFKNLPIWVSHPFYELLEARGKVSSVSEGTTRCASGHGKEFESSEATTTWASGRGKELESSEATTTWASGHGKELESSETTTRWASGHGKPDSWMSLLREVGLPIHENTSIDAVTKVILLQPLLVEDLKDANTLTLQKLNELTSKII
jgi:hypothetical protein